MTEETYNKIINQIKSMTKEEYNKLLEESKEMDKEYDIRYRIGDETKGFKLGS